MGGANDSNSSADVLPDEDASNRVEPVKDRYTTSGSKRFGKVVKFGEKEEIKEKHVHDMKETTTKVLLSGRGYDILKQRECSCGRKETYDIKERVIL